MLFLMIFFIVIYVVGRAATIAQNAASGGEYGPCKQHQWEYDSTGFLICKRCKKRPGYQGRDDGQA